MANFIISVLGVEEITTDDAAYKDYVVKHYRKQGCSVIVADMDEEDDDDDESTLDSVIRHTRQYGR